MNDIRTFRTVTAQLPPELRQYASMLPGIIVAIIAIIGLMTSFFTVAQDEVGVVRLFGRYVRTAPSGLHWKLPFGIERATKVRVEYVYKEEFGFFTQVSRARSPAVRPGHDIETSQMLTGDLNIADVEWIVQFKIGDPVKYLFKVDDVRGTLRNLSEAVMRRVVGDRSVTEVLTFGRAEIATEVEEQIQELLDQYETGLAITTVQLKDVNPPDTVRPSFNEVNEARQEKERITNQAYEDYNKAIPEAEGTAKRAVSLAEGYAVDRVNRAKGDAERFTDLLKEYRRAPKVTRRRLYLEAMAEVLPTISQKYVVDERIRGLLPLLDLSSPARGKRSSEGKEP